MATQLPSRASLIPENVQGEHAVYKDFDAWLSPERRRPVLNMGILDAAKTVQLIYRNGTPRGAFNFAADPRFKSSPPGSAYNGLDGLQAGHMWPARHAFYDKTLKALAETNFTTNVVPEASSLNMGLDQQIEASLVRRAALQNPIVIYKGTDGDSLGVTPTGIDIPKGIWKLAVDLGTGDYGAWWMPNGAHGAASIAEACVDLATIEHLTGLRFPYALRQDRTFIPLFSHKAPASYIAECRAAGLNAPQEFWKASEDYVAKIFNGAGPDHFPTAFNLLLRALTLSDADGADENGRAFLTFMLRLFKLAYVIHDFRFANADRTEAGFHAANQEMLDNMEILLNAEYPLWQFWWYLERAWWWSKMELAYNACESDAGLQAWLD